MAAVFISKGVTPAIRAGDMRISIKDNGDPDIQVILSLHFDVCPTWLKLSIDHLEQAKLWSRKRSEAWNGTDDSLKAETLEKEFEYSMQAIISMAIAYDSFYSSVKSKILLPKHLTDKWRNNRTSRHSQITETLRQAFKIKTDGTKILKQSIKEIFRFRDLAIHPKGELEQAMFHPELEVGVEWRFVYFCYTNSRILVDEGLKRLNQLIELRGRNQQLEQYCQSLKVMLEPINRLFMEKTDL